MTEEKDKAAAFSLYGKRRTGMKRKMAHYNVVTILLNDTGLT